MVIEPMCRQNPKRQRHFCEACLLDFILIKIWNNFNRVIEIVLK